MSRRLLPGVCIVCRQPVVWNGRIWRNPNRGGMGPRHVCPEDRGTCGAWMPMARERCARRPGHGTEHRSRYSMDNACRAQTGLSPSERKAHTAGVGVSDTPFMSRPASRLLRSQAGRLTHAE